MKDRRRYARPTNLLEAVAACGVSIFGIIALLPATGAAPGPEMGIFILLMLCCVLMLAAAVCMAGYLVVDAQGVRLYKLWTRVELRWEDVRCLGTLTVSGNRHSGRVPMLLISPLERPWEELVFYFEIQRMRNYLRFGDAYSLCLDDDKALRAVTQRYCPLPWMPMDGFGQRGGYRQLRRMYGPPKHGEGKEEQTVTRGLFLRADADMNLKTLALIWRRVMGVLCGRYPAWQLDSFDCPNEKADPEGAYTSREFMRWLDAEPYIFFARAFGYSGEAVRETICDYEDYRRAACRCAVLCVDGGYFEIYCKDENVLEALHADAELRALCDRFEYITDENDGRTTFCI